MTDDERREVLAAAAKRTQEWFARPEVRAGLSAALAANPPRPN